MGIVITDLAVISERRSARLLDPVMSYGLPANLVASTAGLNTGFALVHANATAMIGEIRILATPASVGSIPAKGNQEDHNSMAMGAVRKLMQIIELAQQVLAIELLLSAQAIDLISDKMSGLPMGKGTSILHHWIRQSIDPMWEDRFILRRLRKNDWICEKRRNCGKVFQWFPLFKQKRIAHEWLRPYMRYSFIYCVGAWHSHNTLFPRRALENEYVLRQ